MVVCPVLRGMAAPATTMVIIITVIVRHSRTFNNILPDYVIFEIAKCTIAPHLSRRSKITIRSSLCRRRGRCRSGRTGRAVSLTSLSCRHRVHTFKLSNIKMKCKLVQSIIQNYRNSNCLSNFVC